MIFLGRAYRGPCPLFDADRGILGRDVLNHVAVTLDGPAGEWR